MLPRFWGLSFLQIYVYLKVWKLSLSYISQVLTNGTYKRHIIKVIPGNLKDTHYLCGSSILPIKSLYFDGVTGFLFKNQGTSPYYSSSNGKLHSLSSLLKSQRLCRDEIPLITLLTDLVEILVQLFYARRIWLCE